jgi:GntR family transcriptional regulator
VRVDQPLYQRIADDLRAAITRGDYRPGDSIPPEHTLREQYHVARHTVRQAIAQLTAEGLLLAAGGRGTVVQQPPITLSIDRYSRVLEPGGQRGPFETACAEQGVDGRMQTIEVDRYTADDDVAASLKLKPPYDSVIYRLTHAYAGDQLVQLQEAWLPAALFDGTALGGREKVVGGVYGVMTAAGHPPASCTETVASRLPTRTEATALRIGATVPVLTIERLTRDEDQRPIELRRIVAAASRTVLRYNDLPLRG